ncbi:beta strand repeat-containing protein [Sphingomonas oligophenolica]|uniref:Calx-beta domain-containing protein n=1 Tax=Sphingomonas oligophenolica TaxID=301154 RepID=A0A502CM47_9SPHN|nr:Calx-beta domain-containing protein [Sphingomonas oligophenolica]TPG13209.1 hypothetical protein EAH84_07365 [Sphingomonas oligophenolica]
MVAPGYSITPLSFTEPAAGTATVTIRVTRGDSTNAESLELQIITKTGAPLFGTAEDVDFDFTGYANPNGAHTTSYQFAAGEAFHDFTFGVVGGDGLEGTETFTIKLFGGTNGTNLSFTGNINDPGGPVGSLAIAALTQNEGSGGGTTDFAFTVTRSGSTTGAASATYTIANGTTDANDFVFDAQHPQTGTVNFAAGASTAMVHVPIAADSVVEGDETFTVTLSNATNATIGTAQGTGTISNDDAAIMPAPAPAPAPAPPPNPNGVYVLQGSTPDTVAGGDGDDTYIVQNPRVTIVEKPGEGNDTVYTSISYALDGGSSIETLSTQDQKGTDPINLVGNSFAQYVIGNFANNVLNGNGGADTLIGLKGNDTYAIADPNAVIIENPGEGTDTVYTSVSYALPGSAEIEVLSVATQQGTDNLNLIGNGFSQAIIGNFGNNVLNGNGGIDTLIGLKGNDTYVVGNAASVVIENAGEGFDTVYASVSYSLANGQSIEVLSAQSQGGTEAINLTGNELAQAVIGNNGANVLNGGGGADALYGLGGDDTFAFTTALGNGNVAAIADFGNGADKIALSSSIFGGMASGTLSASNFVIGAAATTAEQHIVYNQATGQLFYDADGSGAGAAVLFATVAPGTVITANMIAVV